MAYPKITVNTGIANQVFAHDTIPIPSPNVATITGSGSSVATGNNDIIAVNKLANSTLTGNDLFTATIAPLPVQATQTGDKVYNTTNPGNALVSAVDSGTVLGLDGNPFLSQPVAYLIVRPFHLIDSSANFLTSSVSIGDIVYNTSTNRAARVLAVNNSIDLTLSVDIFGSNTTYNDNYTVYLDGATGSLSGSSAEGCLLYVSTSVAVEATTAYTDVQVITTAGNTVLFKNFPVGNYLPVQITHLMSTGTTDNSEIGVCLAIW
jgi:hypothetical protein|tara:strand:+ start:739 stop:1527 length:789 start_codon:yes stop_codon:yes gene_type:complete